VPDFETLGAEQSASYHQSEASHHPWQILGPVKIGSLTGAEMGAQTIERGQKRTPNLEVRGARDFSLDYYRSAPKTQATMVTHRVGTKGGKNSAEIAARTDFDEEHITNSIL
jgi:hypothetical protein